MNTSSLKRSLSVALAAFALVACQTPVTQEQSGMVIGGLLGGVVGSQFGHGSGRTAAVILGTLTGVAVGGTVGRSMAERDRYLTAQTLETVRTGVPSQWVNPDTGHRYTVVPTRTYGSDDGPCREYQVSAVIGGRIEQMWGTACRQADGSWRAQP
ncbi:MAG: RT0821/Lpp0805 family surface protein [Hydrogenophaga sp.]|uniref:RT0821/Lpp0805 family surface protein n=1 Tax=Hydrogenophaga sp. TaxID=1904254 RepID=UPI002ABD01F2|nr:RT0821/Lpp0805 family surface protein [Hydrogenophaga sp.]MDZ4100741.1 RT0821/Lpp0805 family surface protein [Hydrogenophaga sp.]